MRQGMLNLPSDYVPHRCTGVRGCSYNCTLSERVCMRFVRQTKHAVVKHRLNVCASFFVIFYLMKAYSGLFGMISMEDFTAYRLLGK